MNNLTPSGTLPLDPSLVPRPELCRLAMRVAPSGLDVVIVSIINDNSLIWRHLPFAGNSVDGGIDIKAFEDTVYDNRLLLSEFTAIDVIIDTRRFMAIPAEKATEDYCEEVFAELYPDSADDEVIISEATEDAAIAAFVPTALTAFIRRTFGVRARIYHRMAPLCRFFSIKNKLGNNGKLHVHIDNNRADIIAIDREGLLMANTFAITNEMDALYYTLAAARSLDFDNSTDRVIISGDTEIRDHLLPLMRKYVSYAMPMIFPSDIFKLGRDALSAPFELIALPLLD